MTQDILLLLLPYLTTANAQDLFEVCAASDVLAAKDGGVQKRGYKTLSKLLEDSEVDVDVEGVLKKLQEVDVADAVASGAKKDRFTLLTRLIPRLPPSALHVMPSLIPEAVLGTKETSEKARTAAFELVLAMGRKMGEGGVVKRGLVDGMMAEDDAEDGKSAPRLPF